MPTAWVLRVVELETVVKVWGKCVIIGYSDSVCIVPGVSNQGLWSVSKGRTQNGHQHKPLH